MGRVGIILSFARSVFRGENSPEIVVDRGGGDRRTRLHWSSPGDDSPPLAGDYSVSVSLPARGSEGSVGYIDPATSLISKAGEKRIYSRSAPGVQAAHVHVKSTGEIEISNDAGAVQLLPGGDVNINGVIITASGDVIIPSSLNLGGKELNDHDHAIIGGSSAPGPTGVNN